MTHKTGADMKNPFSYSGIVTKKAFCNREQELAQIGQLVRNSQNVLLYSHRKTGKSSLLMELFRQIREQGRDIKTMYVDLYGTLTEQDFVDALFGALPQIEPHYKRIVKALPGVKVSMSVDPATGSPLFSVSAAPSERKHLLSRTMDILKSYSHKSRLAIALDEFQEVSEYGDDGFEKRLRSFIQTQDRISYIFSGSQAHILAEMFQTAKRPFYQSAHSFPLQPIDKASYVAWARELFARKGVDLPQEVAEEVVDRCEYQPLYIQHFFSRLWQTRTLDLDKVAGIEQEIIQSHKNEYITIFDTLTANQKKALKLIAATDGQGMYHTESLQSVGFSSSSLLARAVDALEGKGLIAKNGTYRIQDVMLKKWILSIS